MIVQVEFNGVIMYLTNYDEEKKLITYKNDINQARKFESQKEIDEIPIISNYCLV